MTINVRRAGVEDFDAVIRLIEALADYERLDPPDAAAHRRLKQDGWPEEGRAPRFKAWLAEAVDHGIPGSRPVGYAITFETYSSFLARPTLYIEDIFVLPDYRRSGVGTALFQRLVEEAQTNGCGRVEWVVLDWNTSAQQFYRRHGARHLTEWQTYRLTLDGPAPED